MWLAKDIVSSPKDITNFSIALAEFQNQADFGMRAGFFLSALINRSKEKGFMIITKHLENSVDVIGCGNEKIITIDGDGGSYLGYRMGGGEITVNGNAGWHVASEMQDGTITVKGDVQGYLGNDMSSGIVRVEGDAGQGVGSLLHGGTLIVEGDAPADVGYQLRGGDIHLNGDYGLIGNEIENGNIYHKGKLIVWKGWKLRWRIPWLGLK